MRARVYDRNRKTYYISEVYGILNCGYTYYLVDAPDDPEQIVLAAYLDFSSKPPYDVHVEIIDCNASGLEWIYREKREMEQLNLAVNEEGKYHYFNGYAFIWEQQEALARLAAQGCIDKKILSVPWLSSKLRGWNYIETQEDIDGLLRQFDGFHDSVLKEFHYITGDYVLPDGSMQLCPSGQKRARAVFESQWEKPVEMILLAPRHIQLIPPAENEMGSLYDASLFIRDCMVYFYDSYMQSMPETYEGTYFAAMGMMWRNPEQ